MKRSPIQEITSSNQKISYGMLGFMLCLLGMLLGGAMASMLSVLGENVIAVGKAQTIFGMGIAAVGGIAGCVLARIFRKKIPALKLLFLCPWVILMLTTTPAGIRSGAVAWTSEWIRGFNRIHEDYIAVLTGSATVENVRAFLFFITLLTAQLLWWAVVYNQMWEVYLFGLCWVLLPLLSGTFSPLFCGCMLAGTLGLSMSRDREKTWKLRNVWTLAITLILLLLTAFVPEGEIKAVQDLRGYIEDSIYIFRYGEKTLPEGNLYLAGELQQEQGEMLRVHSDQRKALYLKNYSGGNYVAGHFEALSDADYGEEHAGMFRWLSGEGFDPFTQVAQYYALGAEEDRPEANELRIRAGEADRARLYVPSSLEEITGSRNREKNDQWIESRGVRGLREYTITEVSGSRPAELLVTADWVSAPQNEEQEAYCAAESVYRDFVYEKYTELDSGMYDLMQKWFWEDYTSEGDGIYSAVTQIRNRLRDRTRYTAVPEQAPEGADPIHYFLTQSKQGNAMLYAATAVEALRAHGIPARYAEGYYVSEQALSESTDGTVSVLGEDAHAWAEVYFDGIGWLPVDVTPGYYYDAVKLQQMVATPDMVHKTLAQDNNRMDAEQITDSGSDADTPGEEIVETIRNLGAFRLGLAALALVLFVLVIMAAEILRILFLWRENRSYDRKTPEERAVDMERKLLYFLKIRGIEARLGWNTNAVEVAVIERIPEIRTGEYRRICDLLQKTIYGNIAMEPYEERTVNYFLRKLYRPEPGSSFIFRWRLRYGIVGYERERSREKRRRRPLSKKNALEENL